MSAFDIPTGGSARVTLDAPRIQDNRRGNATTLCALLFAAAALVGCPAPADLPEDGTHVIALVRLDGEPVHEHRPTRMRVLVTELGMAVDPTQAPASFEPSRIDAIGQHASVYQPDLLIGLDAPFGGPFLDAANPAEALAVSVDRFYRLEARTSIPRRRSDSVPVSPATGGALALSEYPLESTAFATPVARPLAPFYFAPFVAEFHLQVPGEPIPVLIRDGLSPDAEHGGVQVIRGGGSCAGLQTDGQFPICLQTPESWELLRHEVVADFAGLGLRAIKAEYRLPDSVPVAAE